MSFKYCRNGVLLFNPGRIKADKCGDFAAIAIPETVTAELEKMESCRAEKEKALEVGTRNSYCCIQKIKSRSNFLDAEASLAGVFYAINRRGQVLLATANEATSVSFLINLELAVDLPKRGNLPGAENLVVHRFLELFAQTKHKEAAELAVESPQGILRTPDTVDEFQACIFVFLGAGISPALVSVSEFVKLVAV
ncbi:hypothetical protein Vadar_009948 [Vaccinium darrowii]|uniref:Uncharacterized protein n=1 Tax=Vaccinium darrowii TaxID=229202 RepID=A0ACB7X959_9ERIC|nr:hypothetical protein Vadar_009948 [Vaccinium darrowii]